MFSWYILALKFLKYIRNLDTIIPEKIVPQMLPEIRSCPTEDPKLQNSQFFFPFHRLTDRRFSRKSAVYHLLAPASGEILKCGVTPIFLCLWTALAWHKQCNYKPIHYEIIRLASGNTFRSMCKWKFRKYGSIKLSFGSYKCRRTHGTCPCSYKDPFLSFFSLIFLFAMERSTLNSEVPSLQTYRFVPGTTAEKHEHSEFANCCQTDPAAIWTSQIHFREKHFSTMERETEEIRVCVCKTCNIIL